MFQIPTDYLLIFPCFSLVKINWHNYIEIADVNANILVWNILNKCIVYDIYPFLSLQFKTSVMSVYLCTIQHPYCTTTNSIGPIHNSWEVCLAQNRGFFWPNSPISLVHIALWPCVMPFFNWQGR